jgi:hypothetical protein
VAITFPNNLKPNNRRVILMKRKLSKAMLVCILAVSVSITGCGSGDTTSNESTATTGIAQQYSDTKDDSATEKNTEENTTTKSDTSTSDNSTSANNTDINTSTSEGLEYESNGDGTCTITGLGTCTDTDIVIPTVSPTGDTVTMIDKYAFYNLDDIDSLTFIDCEYEIGEYSFEYGEYKTINFIGGNPQIEKSAFAACEKLNEVNFVDCNIQIGEYGFYDGGKDMSITFNNCTGTIGEYSFEYCDAVSIEINNCDLEIDKSAFAALDNVTSIKFADSTITTDEYAFYGSGDEAIIEVTGCTLYFDEYAFEYGSFASVTIIGDSLEIERSAFAACEDLTTVVIDCGKVVLDEYAFYSCKDLVEVSICDNSESDNEISIDDYAFEYCEDLESVTIGNGTIKIGKYVFTGSDNNPAIIIAGQTYTADQIRDGIK